MRITRRYAICAIAAGAMVCLNACGAGTPISSEVQKDISRSGLRAAAGGTVNRLMTSQPDAARILRSARALLVFPEMVRGGLLLGASLGDGVWYDGGETPKYYRSTAVSLGLQAGITSFGYVMAFMDQDTADDFQASDGWEVGIGPTITVADEGFAKRWTTSTLKDGIIVFFVDQSGFFAGSGLEGTKITRLSQ